MREEHIGIVRDNDDPDQRGRLKVECPTIVTGEVMSGWIDPEFEFVDSSQNAGSMWIPNIDSQVVVTIESDRAAGVNGLDPRWKCQLYPIGTVPEEFKTNYPNRRGWVTKEGHTLIFDDTEDDIQFYYKHPSGTEIRVTNDGEIQLSPAAGQSVLVGSGADQQLVRGNILDSYLSSLKGWLDNLELPVVGATAGPPSVSSPSVPSNLLSDDHKVK